MKPRTTAAIVIPAGMSAFRQSWPTKATERVKSENLAEELTSPALFLQLTNAIKLFYCVPPLVCGVHVCKCSRVFVSTDSDQSVRLGVFLYSSSPFSSNFIC